MRRHGGASEQHASGFELEAGATAPGLDCLRGHLDRGVRRGNRIHHPHLPAAVANLEASTQKQAVTRSRKCQKPLWLKRSRSATAKAASRG